MTFGSPSFIAAHLLGKNDPRLGQVKSVRSATRDYPNTSGPFNTGGIAGRAMSQFTITEIVLFDGKRLYYGDDRFIGYTDTAVPDIVENFPRIYADTEGMKNRYGAEYAPRPFPVPLPPK